MTRLALILSFILSSSMATADDLKRGMGAFLGVGLSIGADQLTPDSSSSTAKFKSQGYLLEVGFDLPFSGGFGAFVSGEAGQSNAINQIQSTTYLEIGSQNFYMAKVGFFLGHFALGGGYRHTDVKVRSMSSPGIGYVESNYSGYLPAGFINYSVDINGRYRAQAELQDVFGTIEGSGSTSKVKINEITAGLRVFFLFD